MEMGRNLFGIGIYPPKCRRYGIAFAFIVFFSTFVKAQDVVLDGICYTLNDITGCAGVVKKASKYLGIVSIPDTIHKDNRRYAVTSIEKEAFAVCDSLTNVILPKTIKSIEDGAFAYAKRLREVNFPDSLEKIGQHAFQGCDSLCDLTIFGNNLKIGWLAFSDPMETRPPMKVVFMTDSVTFEKSIFLGCRINSIVLPKRQKYISEHMFDHCYALKHLDFPPELEEIGKAAFIYCEYLREAILPERTKTVEESAFTGCTNLKKIYLPASLERFSCIAVDGDSLEHVYCLANNICFCNPAYAKATLYVPRKLYQHYKKTATDYVKDIVIIKNKRRFLKMIKERGNC